MKSADGSPTTCAGVEMVSACVIKLAEDLDSLALWVASRRITLHGPSLPNHFPDASPSTLSAV